MQQLIQTIKCALSKSSSLPFSVYSSVKEQRIFNVPVVKPVLICVLNGFKHLGHQGEVVCPSGSFIFLSNNPSIDMRNIPSGNEYFAMLIEFEEKDFDSLKRHAHNNELYFQGRIEGTLEFALQQFVEWSVHAPSDIWYVRRQEILQTLLHLGYQQVCGVMASQRISHRIHRLISQDVAASWSVAQLASMLAMSESTLRRRLNDENSSVQHIKENVRLGYGLHLVQSTDEPIGLISEKCGYGSQSRFTDKFKQLFGITPSELRKTKLSD